MSRTRWSPIALGAIPSDKSQFALILMRLREDAVAEHPEHAD